MYVLLVNDTGNKVSLKCTTCEAVTDHLFQEVQPIEVDSNNNPLAKGLQERIKEAELTRNINLCTKCGKLSLKK